MILTWEKCKSELKKRLDDHLYEIWICPINIVSHVENSVTLSVPNSYYKDKINSEYLYLIQDVYNSQTNQKISLSFIIVDNDKKKSESKEQIPKIQYSSSIKPASNKNPSRGIGLNPKYHFKNFIVGPCNQFSHAASNAVANNPGNAYNPLFIYGGVGLGKTHLMQAIGNIVIKKNPSMKVLYVTSETFINDLITSLQKGRMTHFRDRYRTIDVLIVDDIHFIAGKERSQEEFFHTFNTLFDLKKQIVISSDKYPREMPKLEERLRSRFEWGLIADIKPPEFETKVAILFQKAEDLSINLPGEVAEYIAHKIRTNVRELEGCLSRLVAVSSLSGKNISIEMAEETFRDIFQNREKGLEISDIQKETCEFYGIKVSLIKSKKRNRSIAIPRHVAMYLCKKLTNFSLSEIGKSFGGKDHTTVIHAYKKIDLQLKENNELQSSVKHIKRALEL